MFWKRKQFWGSLIAVALLIYCLKGIKYHEIVELSHRLNLLFLIPSVIFAFLFVICRALRWRLMVSQQKILSMFRSISLYSAGQILNIVMPMLTGQVGRMFLFSKNEGYKKSFIFSTIVLEILFDSISLIIFLLLTSIAFVLPDQYSFVGYIIAGVTIILIIILYLILHYQEKLELFCNNKFRERWPGFYINIKKFLRSFVQGINLIKSSQNFASSLVYSLMAWVTHTFVVYFLMLSFGYNLPFAAAASVMIINTLALMIPITPGNAGTFEVAVSTSLLAFGVVRSDAVLFALALHILDLIPIGILGYIYMHLEKVSIRQIKSEHEDDLIYDKISEDGSYVFEEEEPI